MPVDSLAPKTNANPVTISEAIPLIPAFEIPSRKAQKAAIKKFSELISSNYRWFVFPSEDNIYLGYVVFCCNRLFLVKYK